MEKIIVIGGGGTGGALAYDLALRGMKVSLFERGELTSGASGRHHGLLHSGARYATTDKKAAEECIRENMILRKIAPEALELNDGLFVAVDDEDMSYLDAFLAACEECGIPAEQITPEKARLMEPNLSENLKMAVRIPDGTIDAWRLPMSFFAAAKDKGALIKNFSEVVGIHKSGNSIVGVKVLDHASGKKYDEYADMVVNATGAWAGKIADMAGVNIPIQPGPGVMLALNARLTNMVIDRLRPPGQGDIIVPQRKYSVLGTSLWLADDPENIRLPESHSNMIIDSCSKMVPLSAKTPLRAVWGASRPLIKSEIPVDDPQDISRTFDCFDHEARDGLAGIVSIIGGKATTLRGMAEKTADLICRKFDKDVECRTEKAVLPSWRKFYC